MPDDHEMAVGVGGVPDGREDDADERLYKAKAGGRNGVC